MSNQIGRETRLRSDEDLDIEYNPPEIVDIPQPQLTREEIETRLAQAAVLIDEQLPEELRQHWHDELAILEYRLENLYYGDLPFTLKMLSHELNPDAEGTFTYRLNKVILMARAEQFANFAGRIIDLDVDQQRELVLGLSLRISSILEYFEMSDEKRHEYRNLKIDIDSRYINSYGFEGPDSEAIARVAAWSELSNLYSAIQGTYRRRLDQ